MNIVTRVCAVGLLLISMACGGGGGSSSPTDPTPTPTPTPTPGLQNATFTGTVPAYGTVSHELTLTAAGTLTASLSWTDTTADLDLYVTDSSCSGYPPLDCAVLVRSVADTGVAEQISRAVKTGDKFLLWIDNLAPSKTVSYTLNAVVK